VTGYGTPRSEIESRWLRGNSDRDLSRVIAGDCCGHRSNFHLVRFADIDAALKERLCGVKMRLLAKDPWTPPHTDLSVPIGCLTKSRSSGNAEYKPASDPSTAVAPGPRDLFTAEQEQVMAEHLRAVYPPAHS
jgi:hypothetical protein